MILTGNPMQARIGSWLKKARDAAPQHQPVSGDLTAAASAAIFVLLTALLTVIAGWVLGERILEAAHVGFWISAVGLIVLLIRPQLSRLLAIPYATATGLAVVHLTHLFSDPEVVFNLWPIWLVLTTLFTGLLAALTYLTPGLARLPGLIRVIICPILSGLVLAPIATLLLAVTEPVSVGEPIDESLFLGPFFIVLVGVNTAVCFRVVRAAAAGPAWTRWGAGIALIVGVWWVIVSVIFIALALVIAFFGSLGEGDGGWMGDGCLDWD